MSLSIEDTTKATIWFEIYCLGFNNQQRKLRKQKPLDFQFIESVGTDGQSFVGTSNIRDKNSHSVDRYSSEEDIANSEKEKVGE
jgi:hypothetical protein